MLAHFEILDLEIRRFELWISKFEIWCLLQTIPELSCEVLGSSSLEVSEIQIPKITLGLGEFPWSACLNRHQNDLPVSLKLFQPLESEIEHFFSPRLSGVRAGSRECFQWAHCRRRSHWNNSTNIISKNYPSSCCKWTSPVRKPTRCIEMRERKVWKKRVKDGTNFTPVKVFEDLVKNESQAHAVYMKNGSFFTSSFSKWYFSCFRPDSKVPQNFPSQTVVLTRVV